MFNDRFSSSSTLGTFAPMLTTDMKSSNSSQEHNANGNHVAAISPAEMDWEDFF
jgi:hypothetical protein